MAVAIADAIGSLETDAERETVLIFGGALLLDGLLDAASVHARNAAERLAAQRALIALLSTGAPQVCLGHVGALSAQGLELQRRTHTFDTPAGRS